MEMESLVKYSTKNQENLENIRVAQSEHNFILPSDYVWFLLNLNGFEFEEIPIINVEGDEYEFGEFYDLETLVWELNHYRGMIENYNHSFWLKDYLSIGNIDDHRIVMGVTPKNINEIFLYNDEEGTITKLSDNLYDFIKSKLQIT